MHSYRLFLWCVLATLMLRPVPADPRPPIDPTQVEYDRFARLIADGMWANGRITEMTAPPEATDQILIDTAARQLNKNPAPLKTWKILKLEHVSTGPPLYSRRYLIAVIDSNQGHKIIAIGEGNTKGMHWARIYNCDAVFSSPMAGGTPLIR